LVGADGDAAYKKGERSAVFVIDVVGMEEEPFFFSFSAFFACFLFSLDFFEDIQTQKDKKKKKQMKT